MVENLGEFFISFIGEISQNYGPRSFVLMKWVFTFFGEEKVLQNLFD
jgi:hypothetical protein